MSRLLILGSGQAGLQLAVSARAEGFAGEIIVIGDEPFMPYKRPPLSKEYLAKKANIEQLLLRPEDFYRQQRIDLQRGVRAVEIDRAHQQVRLSDGRALTYTALALTLGARVRYLSVPGAEKEGVYYLRSMADVHLLHDALDRLLAGRPAHSTQHRAVIVGGGFVGLETAAVLNSLGLAVTVIEREPRVMPRVVSSTVSAFYERVHSQRGVQLVTSAEVRSIESVGAELTVNCSNGMSYGANLVVVGIGVVPNQELAMAAGLACENGILVDEFARTSDPNIVAAGDCTFHPNPLLGKRLRLESVHNAIAQATTAAQTVCNKPAPYAQIPWFWSDQYEFKLQMAGLYEGHDEEAVRGNLEQGKFSIFYYRDRRLVAVDSVNSVAEHQLGKRMLLQGRVPTPDQARDRTFELKSLFAAGS